ncbi:hypothetical protein HDU67_004620, partial [Dinochytrium kinnereticum]
MSNFETLQELPPPMSEPEGLSSGLHLIWGSGSGPAQRIQIALKEKSIPFTSHMVSFSAGDTRRAEWIAKLNPRKQVPILIDNGFAVSQSISILLYLEERFPGIDLLSKDLKVKTETITRAIEADEVLRPLVREVFALARPDATEEGKQKVFKNVGDEMDKWEAYLAKNESGWLVGTTISIADITLFPPFMMLVERFGLEFGSRKHLEAWFKSMMSRPSVLESVPPHWSTTPPKALPFKNIA